MNVTIKRSIKLPLLFFTVILLMIPGISYAQVTIPRPTDAGITDPFKMRSATRPHKGVDYGTPCGTRLPTAAPVTACNLQQAGAGLYATVDHGCGVQERYMHLHECNVGASSVVTGGEAGGATSGNSSGCHLHYDISVNGCFVNPESAFGQDLCLEATKRPLFDEAQSVLGSYASCSGSNTGDQQGSSPPTQPGDPNRPISIILIIPGGVNPITGEINDGDPYYITITEDGRIIIDPVLDLGPNELPVLPPTTSDVVPTTETGNDITGCATDTWTAMVNQSVLQARRDMMFSKAHILKPDSVMAYSCFYQAARQVSENLGPIFSETKDWVNKQIDIEGKTVTINRELGETSLDGAINNSALATYEYFLTPNFNHSFLGGSMGHGLAEDDEHGAVQAYLDCGVMQQVWQYAKCKIPENATIYPRFEDLVSGDSDPRTMPENMSCMNTGINQDMIALARGENIRMSPMEDYSAIITLESDSTSNGDCYPPIYTGVTVERQKGAGIISRTVRYQDGICITQGCSYRNSGSGSGTCELEP